MMSFFHTRRTFLQQTVCAVAASLPSYGWLPAGEPAKAESGIPKKVESGSLKEVMNRAGECCLAWLDPKHAFFPTGGYEIAHDSGRWWDALLRLEIATGFVIPAKLEAAMLRNIQKLMGNPDGLLMNDVSLGGIKGGKAQINPHNFREGILSLTALAHYRKSVWAREAGHRLIETIDRCFQPDGRFDYTRLQCWGRLPLSDDPCHLQPSGAPWFDGTANSGRALEAIVWFQEGQRGSPVGPKPREPYPKDAVAWTQLRTFDGLSENRQLLSQGQVLDGQVDLGN